MPRHFLQTAARNGIPASVVKGIFNELLETEQRAVRKALDELPAGFPDKLARSIVNGLRAHLRLVRGEAG